MCVRVSQFAIYYVINATHGMVTTSFPAIRFTLTICVSHQGNFSSPKRGIECECYVNVCVHVFVYSVQCTRYTKPMKRLLLSPYWKIAGIGRRMHRQILLQCVRLHWFMYNVERIHIHEIPYAALTTSRIDSIHIQWIFQLCSFGILELVVFQVAAKGAHAVICAFKYSYC